jgi:hypothetical protein
MRTYKFLRRGGIGPFSRYAWPLPRGGRPGAWVLAGGGAVICHTAIHACRVRDLPWWLQDELWEAELDGTVTTGRHKVMAPRARLVRRVAAWDEGCAQRFADACAFRARNHAAAALDRAGATDLAVALRAAAGTREVRDLAYGSAPPDAAVVVVRMAGDGATRALGGAAIVSAYIAAHAAARVDGAPALAAERAWQADWLAGALALMS